MYMAELPSICDDITNLATLFCLKTFEIHMSFKNFFDALVVACVIAEN